MESDHAKILNKCHIHVALIGSQFVEECEYMHLKFLSCNDMGYMSVYSDASFTYYADE